MFRTALLAIYIFWFMDLLNLDFMEPFDDVYKLNGLFWLGTLILTMLFSCISIPEENKEG